ncbi:hypothetical protein Barb7_00864 [Bacteroidales bacterium Barb7]|nr:hypothetical protein Barb7_00864 [Bacteroidales bacterium Barb7]
MDNVVIFLLLRDVNKKKVVKLSVNPLAVSDYHKFRGLTSFFNELNIAVNFG